MNRNGIFFQRKWPGVTGMRLSPPDGPAEVGAAAARKRIFEAASK